MKLFHNPVRSNATCGRKRWCIYLSALPICFVTVSLVKATLPLFQHYLFCSRGTSRPQISKEKGLYHLIPPVCTLTPVWAVWSRKIYEITPPGFCLRKLLGVGREEPFLPSPQHHSKPMWVLLLFLEAVPVQKHRKTMFLNDPL